MSFATSSSCISDESVWVVRATQSLQLADFSHVHHILDNVMASGGGASPAFWLLKGTCEEYQGRFPEAISTYETGLETARRSFSFEFQWRFCFVLNRVYRRLDQQVPARQYLSWGMTSYFRCPLTGPTDESRLALLLGTTDKVLPDLQLLHQIHRETTSPEAKAEIEWMIARQLNGAAGLPWLSAACHHFRQAGNCYASMLCRERAAKTLLQVQRWQEGVQSLRFAQREAENLGLSTHVAHYSRWTGQLRRALIILNQNAALN